MYPESYSSEPTRRTPWIILEPGMIFIMGRSIIDNPGSIYEPVHKWLSGYIHNHTGKTRIELGFEFINTGSLKWLYIMLRELAVMDGLTENAAITWHYERGDEDMLELGHTIQSLFQCPFRLVEEEDMDDECYGRILDGLLP